MRKGIKQYLNDANIVEKADIKLEGLKVLYRYSRHDLCVTGTIHASSLQDSAVMVEFDSGALIVSHPNSLEVICNEC